MFFLILAVLCSAGNALTMKFAGSRSNNSKSLVMINYLMCVVLGAVLVGTSGVDLASTPPLVLGLGSLNGLLYILSLVLFQTNIARNGATVSSSASRLSVVIPVLVSIFLFGENPAALQLAGLAVGLLALIAMAAPTNDGKNKAELVSHSMRWLLVPQVIASGSTDVLAKLYEVYCDPMYQQLFILLTFAVALVLSVFMVIRAKERPKLIDIVCGIILGTFNYFSSSLLLRAVIELPAFIAFTGFCLGVILVMNVANILVLKEKLATKDYVAMVIIVAAFALLYAPM